MDSVRRADDGKGLREGALFPVGMKNRAIGCRPNRCTMAGADAGFIGWGCDDRIECGRLDMTFVRQQRCARASVHVAKMGVCVHAMGLQGVFCGGSPRQALRAWGVATAPHTMQSYLPDGEPLLRADPINCLSWSCLCSFLPPLPKPPLPLPVETCSHRS